VAARYAYEDAIIDHGDGEGMYAEIFCAALESAAFVESRIERLIDIGLSYIPDSCGVAQAVRAVIADQRAGRSWEEAREHLLASYRGRSAGWAGIAREEREKGYAEGRLGWDVPSNIGIVVIGLLYGAGDFDRSLCVAVNCGEDTDCTAGTVGSICGIVRGAQAIPPRWTEPIGRAIKTGTLNLGELGNYGDQLPATVDDLTARVVQITRRAIQAKHLPVEIASGAGAKSQYEALESLSAIDNGLSIHGKAGRTVHRFAFFTVLLDYGGDATIRPAEPKRLQLQILNNYKTPEMLRLRWYGSEGCVIRPSHSTTLLVQAIPPRSASVEVDIVLDRLESVNRLVLEISVVGRSDVMLVPIVLLERYVVGEQGQ
jgi:hypothetical protein